MQKPMWLTQASPDQTAKVVGQLNEVKYKATLKPVLDHLIKARDLTTHTGLRLYLDSKIEEVRHGTNESRRISDFMWIRHGSPIDLILSSALEVYLDNWKNARGEAAAAIMVENNEAQSTLQALVDRLPGLEATAPWKHRKMQIDKDKLPHLRFVDVLNWSGDYVNIEAEYSPLEEARAELFGMWAMPQMARDGVFSMKTAEAGHYGMVISMVGGLRFLPEQAHVKARNFMWHYFVQNGGVEDVMEDGKKKFRLRLARIDELVAALLGIVGDTKAAGDKAAATKLRETYCFTDPMRDDVEARMASFPLGRGLIFPRIKRNGENYLAESLSIRLHLLTKQDTLQSFWISQSIRYHILIRSPQGELKGFAY
ncbi:MAG: hypothetical protein IPP40_07985 [bacterium]|nr:hypothetical protein [bacterium]